MDIVRQHEISEAENRILNPFDEGKLMLLGEVCRLQTGQRQLDLACGKGEMLCRWAARFGIEGLGVDISDVFLAAARIQ
jgi:cyclopropane fatty-acyl-phospholipid synthase-like methyltransferase